MSFAFSPDEGLVVVHAEMVGPLGSIILRLALDTGATATMINAALLTAIGYDPSATLERVQVTTGSGVEYVPRVEIARVKVLGHERTSF